MRILLILLSLAPLRAEYLRIEQDFGAMDCASCSEFIQNKLNKNQGVQSVEVDRKRNVVRVILKPGNTVRVRQVRDFVEQSGFKPKETRVTVRGVAWVDRGITTLKIPELNEAIRVRDEEMGLRMFYNKKVEVTGRIESVMSEGSRIDILVVEKVEGPKQSKEVAARP
ncbi:MAG TPA: heavy metal-associated domain-containing protein [Bryobacteraceae bacterium]|nr:heavy metal-associated domain-containing protein [Bryobacteraceae bacterium]